MKTMSDLDNLMDVVRRLPKRNKGTETNWRLWNVIRAEKQLWVTLDLGEKGLRTVLVAKGTYLGALLRYCGVEYRKGAKLTKDGNVCNLSERIDKECVVGYK